MTDEIQERIVASINSAITEVARGERFVWRLDDDPDRPVYMEVIRVARDGTWADIRCYTWAVSWSKRQPLPLPNGSRRYRWTQDDLDRDAQRVLHGIEAES